MNLRSFCALVLMTGLPVAHAQIPITGTTAVVESFNTLSGLNLPTGWQMSAAGAGASANWDASGNATTVTVNHTSSTTIPAAGRIFWNYLNGSGATQSVGFYTSGSYASSNAILARYQNSTNEVITALRVDYRRDRRITRTDSTASGSPTFEFSYSTDGTNWTRVAGSDTGAWNSFFNSATPGSGTVLSGAAPTANISGLQVPPGGSFYLRWNVITLHSGVHWGFGLDNVATQVTGTAPAQLYWLGDDTTRGGQGTWTNSGGSAWTGTNADGGPGVAWDPARTGEFGGTIPSTVTLSGTVNANLGLIFRQGGSSLNGGTLALGAANKAANLLNIESGDVTFSTDVSGSKGLTKSGAGNLIFAQAMSYNGGTDVAAGTLTVAPGAALGGDDVALSSGATLALQNNLAISNTAALRLVTGSTVNLGFTPGTEEIVAALFLNGVAQPNGTYGATGSGAQFPNNAFFSGSGLLRVGDPPPIPTALFWVGDDAARGGSGTWSNTGGVAWASIDADIPGGDWDPTKTAVFGGAEAPFATVSGEISAQRGMLFRTSGTTVTGGTVNLGGATRNDNLLEVLADTAATIQSNLTGTSGLKKSGPGTLILSSPMTYTGGTEIATGTLAVSSTGALGEGDVVVTPGTLLLLENPNAIPDTATVILTSSGPNFGKIDLGFAAGDEERVDALVINGVSQAIGTYGTTESGAENVNNDFFIGSGILRVGVSSFITATGNPAVLDTIYGTPSGTTSFVLSGTGLADGITLTPPPGYEVSTDASFSSDVGDNLSPIVVGTGGDVPETTIYLRLEPNSNAGVYSGNIALTSAGAAAVNVATAPSTVAPKPLSITPPVIAEKIYDGSPAPASVIAGVLSGLIGSETLSVSGIAQAFPSKNVGSYPGLVVSYVLGDGTNGGLAANYSLVPGTGTTAITPAPVSITGLTAENKTYDATTTATVSGTPTLSGVLGADDVSLDGTALFAFAQAGAGTAIPVTTSGLTLTGADAGNYSLTLPALSADIEKAPQTISFAALPEKTTADAPFELTATATSGLPVSYTSADPAVAEVSGSMVTLLTGGSTIITASQPGDANFLPAADVPQTLTVNATFAGQFDFAPHDGVATSIAYNGTAIPNVTVSAMTIVGATPGTNDPNLQGQWPNTGTLNPTGAANADLAGSPNTGAYFEFTLTAAPGYVLNDSKLRFNVGRELNGPRQFQWRSSVDGFVSPITATRAIDGSDIEIFSNEFRALDQNFFGPDAINSTNYNEVSLATANRSSVTYRFYAYGAEASNTGARLTRFLNFLVDVTPSTATVPAAPPITGIIPNDGQLRIGFTPPPGNVTGYEYTIDAGQTWIPTSPAIPDSPWVISGLNNGQSYPVQLRAFNDNGTGDASPVQIGIPQPNRIAGLEITDTRTLNGGTYALGAFATSGLPVSIESSNTGVATVSGTTVTIVAPGTTTLTASQPGNGDFAAAPDVTQTLTVLPAGWNLIENFEDRTPGNLDGQNNWLVVIGTPGGTGTTTVTADPADAGNKVATIAGNHSAASRFMASLSPTETVTVFKRFRIENIDTSATSSGESHINMGVSTVPTPTGPGEFSAHTSVTPTVTTPFRIRHSPESAPTNVTVESDIWYSSWYVLDNSTQKFKLYLQGGAQTTPVLAVDGSVTDGVWNYRTPGPGLITAARIYLRSLANHNAPVYIDDIYFAPGEMLGLPDALAPSFANWAASRGLSGTPTDDFDDDLLEDSLEYVFGSDPKAPDSSSPLTFAHNESGALVITFPRDDASETADTVVHVEAGDDLQNWPLVYQVRATTATSSPGVTIAENGAAADLITVVVPPPPGTTRLFGRVVVTVTQP